MATGAMHTQLNHSMTLAELGGLLRRCSGSLSGSSRRESGRACWCSSGTISTRRGWSRCATDGQWSRWRAGEGTVEALVGRGAGSGAGTDGEVQTAATRGVCSWFACDDYRLQEFRRLEMAPHLPPGAGCTDCDETTADALDAEKAAGKAEQAEDETSLRKRSGRAVAAEHGSEAEA